MPSEHPKEGTASGRLLSIAKPKRRIRAFIQLGVSRSWAIRYGYSRMSGWAVACSPIMGTTITEARLRQKGYKPFLDYYFKLRKENR